MRRWVVSLIGLIVLLAGTGFWFWSLGSLPPPSEAFIQLKAVAGQVDIQHAGSDAWQQASDDEKLSPGDTVRTGVHAEATIEFDGHGESRLASKTEIHIERADMVRSTPFVVNLRLVSGRVWSRVLRLLDLNESFVVHTNTVVATVRGTTFNLQTTSAGTTLWVSDAAVQASGGEIGSSAPNLDSAFVVSEGFLATFNAKGKVIASQPLSDNVKQSEWFIKNTAGDKLFVHSITQSLIAQMNAMGGARPGSFTDVLAHNSERLHIMLDPSHAPELYARYTARRLYAIERQIESGKYSVAFQTLSAVQNDIAAHIAGTNGAAYRAKLKISLGDILFLMRGVEFASPAYHMKQIMEDLNVTLAGTDRIDTAYAHLLNIETWLDEAGILIDMSSLDHAKASLDAARQGLQNVERTIDHFPDTVPISRLRALRGKLSGLKIREVSLRIRLATAIVPPTSQIIVPKITATTSTDVIIATSTPATPRFTQLNFTVQPNPSTVGDTVRLSVIGTSSDGSTHDVTARSIFSLSSALGSLNGPIYSATAEGNVTITAMYHDGDTTLNATRSVRINAAPVTLTRIKVVSQGVTSLVSGTRVLLRATAYYSDGSTKDVTQMAQFVTSNPSIGSMSGNLFHAGNAAGMVTITASYTDQAGSAKGGIDMQVTAG